MTSEMTRSAASQEPGSASEITKRGPGARPTGLPAAYDTVLGEYAAALERAPLSAETRRTYRSRVRMFLAWPTTPPTYTSDPLTDRQARDWAVRDYRMWLLRDGPAKRGSVYVNSALTALDDFCTRPGPGQGQHRPGRPPQERAPRTRRARPHPLASRNQDPSQRQRLSAGSSPPIITEAVSPAGISSSSPPRERPRTPIH
ncbi:hypothetical protein [Nonomuraea jabiensis]|uniref:Core-binding (CB) domain-containing protein n=1 Tax=Nonomuraea jabiensis TaxID=882448 RepID=A0A7W9G0G7_9ACTN|nr:hypothetical protein [Nonomuraea jabiensis]MBB5774938.1 hypothetical protein [Nonomuraea jabiensis]